MSSTSQGTPTQPLFTVQQIELIRRLRNSGLTKEQVIQAYESFERVDSDLGNIYTIPVSLMQTNNLTACLLRDKLARSVRSHPLQQPTVTKLSNSSHTPALHPSQAPSLPSDGQNNNSVHVNSPQPSAASMLAAHVNRRFPPRTKEQVVVKLEPEDGSWGDEDGEYGEAKVTATSYSEGNTKDVDDFVNKGTDHMRKEIQDFFCSGPAFVYSDIAARVGVDVARTTQFMMGDFSSLQPGELQRLCQWFVGARVQHTAYQQQQQHCNAQTSKILQGVLQDRLNGAAGNGFGSMDSDTSMDFKSGDSLSAGGVSNTRESDGLAVNFVPRRERFTFRKQHLEVLESYFKTNQYPTYEERTDIAMRCNDIMELVSGRGLGEKERMTPQNVAYWFSNRRKDIKRMAREGGIDMSDVILPSKVKHATPILPDDKEHKDSLSFTPAWPMDTAIPNFSLLDTTVPNYSPLDIPSVGPVAFPPMLQRTVSDIVASLDASSTDSSGDAVVAAKTEAEVTSSVAASTVGPGSVVDRIATVISAQLMSRSGDSTVLTDSGKVSLSTICD